MAKDKKTDIISDSEQSLLNTAETLETEQNNYGVETDMPQDSSLTPEQEAELDRELKLTEKYGNSPATAAALGAARGLSFGLSDLAAVKTGTIDQETLSQYKRKNRAASVLGEVAGTAAPLLLSGGATAPASLAGKGALAAGSAVRAVSKAGQAAELVTANILKKAIAETGTKAVAKKVIQKALSQAAGSAVEGVAYSTGQLLSESALGEAEFNAENLAAAAGTGALFGGAVGGIFGLSETIVPVFKNGKVSGYVSKKLDKNIDDVLASQKLQGMTPTQIAKQNQFSPQVAKNTPEYLRRLAAKNELSAFSSNTKVLEAAKKDIDELGASIAKTLDDVDAIALNTPMLPTRAEVAANVQNRLRSMREEFAGLKTDTAKQNLRKIDRTIKSFDEDLAQDMVQVTGKELNALKSKYQKLAKWDRKGQLPLDEQISREVSRSIKDEVFKVADKVSTVDQNLGQKLRQEFLDYGTSLEFVGNLSKKADGEAAKDFFNFRDYVLGGAAAAIGGGPLAGTALAAQKFLNSDFKRKLLILNKIERSNQIVNNKIGTSLSNFSKNVKKATPAITTKSLLTTSFDIENPKKKAKDTDKKVAFKRISSELLNISSNPEKLVNYLSNSSLESTGAAPLTAQALQQTASTAIAFLTSKLPLQPDQLGAIQMLKNRWNPSDIEISKFERYLQTVKEPLTALDHLENGTLTREHVEALQAVYPDLYGRIQEQTLEKLGADPEAFSYQQRLKLGILLDIPSDVSLAPSNILALQAEFGTEPANQQQAGSIMPRKTDLNFDSNISTDLEKTQRS